jgi:hypothetical protein
MIIALFAQVSFAQNVFTIDGACPDVTFNGSDFRPGDPVVLIHGADAGIARVPDGPCRGRATGLANLEFLTIARVPVDGLWSVSLTLPEAGCDGLYQVLDLRTCALSNTAEVAPAPIPGDTGTSGGADTGL